MKGSTTIKIVTVFILLLFLTGCSVYSAVDTTLRYVTFSKNLSEKSMNEVYGSGATFDYSWASGEEGSITFDKSGTASIQYGDNKDTGSWNIQEEMLCNKWQELGAGEKRCYTVYRKVFKQEKYRLFNEDGSAHATALLK